MPENSGGEDEEGVKSGFQPLDGDYERPNLGRVQGYTPQATNPDRLPDPPEGGTGTSSTNVTKLD